MFSDKFYKKSTLVKVFCDCVVLTIVYHKLRKKNQNRKYALAEYKLTVSNQNQRKNLVNFPSKAARMIVL